MKISSVILMLVTFLLAGCQKEEFEVLTEEDQNAFTTDAQVYDLALRSSMYDGSADDEIDESPCFSLQFPYTVSFSGRELTINSAAERANFISELAQNPVGISFSLQFPVTVKNAAHREVVVQNRQQYLGLQQACRNSLNSGQGPITCARVEFPVLVFTYDRALQQTNSINLNTEEEMFNFLNNLNNNSVVSFDYPLSLILEDERIVVRNNSQLTNLLQSCRD